MFTNGRHVRVVHVAFTIDCIDQPQSSPCEKRAHFSIVIFQEARLECSLTPRKNLMNNAWTLASKSIVEVKWKVDWKRSTFLHRPLYAWARPLYSSNK